QRVGASVASLMNLAVLENRRPHPEGNLPVLIIIGSVLAGLIAAGIIFVGASYFWAPQVASGFGIPRTRGAGRTSRSWLLVKGVRDIAAGVFIAIVIANGSAHLLGWFVLAGALIPGGDCLTVLRSQGPKQ